MSSLLEKSANGLKVSWPPHASVASIIVEFKDVDEEVEWIIMPRTTSSSVTLRGRVPAPDASSNQVEIQGIPEHALNGHTFQTMVLICYPQAMPGIVSGTVASYKVTKSYPATCCTSGQDDNLERLFASLRLARSRTVSRSYHSYIHVNDAATPTVRLSGCGWSSQTATLPSAVGIGVQCGKMLTVLERGRSLPAVNSCQVTTSTDYQTVGLVEVFYGDYSQADRNTLLGSTRLTEIPARRKGEVNLRLALRVDVKGVVTLEATEIISELMWEDTLLDRSIPVINCGSESQKLAVTIDRSTYTQASVTSSQYYPQPDRWLVAVTKDQVLSVLSSNNKWYFVVDGGVQMQFDIPLNFEAGSKYMVSVKALAEPTEINSTSTVSYYRVIGEGTAEFRAELTLADLQYLHQMAVSNCNRYYVDRCQWLYRNRWESYFLDIFNKHRGIMEVYDKDNSGDPASPINGQIKGLFFMAKNINGQPPQDSPFGKCRIQIPAGVLLSMAPNLYFVDFYCMNGKTHYVTLVMTKPGSSADNYCREKLLRLSHDDTPFLFLRGSQWYVNVSNYVLVELFYTENINIVKMITEYGAIFQQDIPPPPGCRGRSTPGGVPKNKVCAKCNLPQPVNHFQSF